MSVSDRLAELGIELPEVVAPLAAYVPAVRTGNLVYTSGQLPMQGGQLPAEGKVGAEVTADDGKALARICGLNALAAVPTAKEARRSVVWAIALIGAFYLFTLVLGYGAAALVGPDRILKAAGGVNSAAPLLAFELGGVILLGVISAVAFATILAVVAGLTITASASFAHDIYASVLKSHKVTEQEQVRVSRITAVVLGVFAIGLGILANGQNVAFLVALAFAVAAAANLPTILYSLYWKRFNTRGALWSMYGGLLSTIVLIVFSPAVSGSKTAMIPGADFAFFPLANPGIVSIPLAFALGIIGTLTSSETGDPAVNAEMEVRSLTGVGAEKAVAH